MTTAYQQRAIDAETGGTPFSRTKVEAKAEVASLAERFQLRASTVFQGTWLGASGDTYDLCLDKAEDGYRVNVHRWYSTGETQVRAIFGSWWRPRKNREGREFSSVTLAPDELDKLAQTVEDALVALRAAKEKKS